ncbi:MAG TPA: hypothetical protein VGB49_09365 [Caulobacteraceae bacterium]|jgi:hypothetical protein
MTKIEVVNGVAAELHATEQAIDAAIAQATSLVGAMIQGRTTASLSPLVAADEQTKIIEAIQALGAARACMVEAHGDFAKTHRKLGLGRFALGPLDKPAEDGPIHPKGVDAGHLRVAAG